jgi:hypothetical protein
MMRGVGELWGAFGWVGWELETGGLVSGGDGWVELKDSKLSSTTAVIKPHIHTVNVIPIFALNLVQFPIPASSCRGRWHAVLSGRTPCRRR